MQQGGYGHARPLLLPLQLASALALEVALGLEDARLPKGRVVEAPLGAPIGDTR